MKKHRFLLPFFCAFAAAFCCFGAARAQPASVAISPASIDAKIKPGASHTQTFTITNGTDARLRFRASVADVWFDERNNRLNGRAGTLPRSAALWIQFAPPEIVVEPHSSAVVKAVITVPSSATGSFYAVPVFEGMSAGKSAPAVQTNVSTASIGVKFRGLMMLTTEAGAEYNVEIINGKISPPTASTGLELELDLRNRGTAHAKVRGAFALLDAAGALVGRGGIEEKRFLPTQRSFVTSRWAGELPPGRYVVVVTLSYNRVGKEPVSLVHEIPFVVK